MSWKCPFCNKKNSNKKWKDKDTLISNGMLKAIDDYISKDGEDAFSVCRWDCPERFVIIEILHYINIEREENEEKLDFLWNKAGINLKFKKNGKIISVAKNENAKKQALELTKKMEEREKEILHKIIDILPFLWT